MKKILLVVAMVLLSAVTAFGWTLKVKVNGISYEGSPLGNEIRYMTQGKVAGYGRQLGNEFIFTSSSGQPLGSVYRLGNDWQFRDAKGQNIGSATPLGNSLLYRNSKGLTIGESYLLGPKTQYKDGRGAFIGEADTVDMPLRPLPLENWLAEQAIPSVCLTYITAVTWEKPAAQAGMRAGDILLGFAGQNWTLFDVLDASHATMHKKVNAKLSAVRELKDIVYIVYRPTHGEKGMAKGEILQLAPMPSGKKGYSYRTSESGPTFNRRNSINYVEQIKRLYLSVKPQAAPVNIPNSEAYRKDSRAVPGAHQEFREILSKDSAQSQWVWISDKDGSMLSVERVNQILYQEQMKNQPVVTIRSYPMAKIFLSTTADSGSGNPHLNRNFKFIGMTDGNGFFIHSGKAAYTLPVGTRCLAFFKSGKESEFDDASVGADPVPMEQDPVLLSLPDEQRAQLIAMLQQYPENYRSQALAALKAQLKSAANPNEKYLECFNYAPIKQGQTVYILKR